MRSLNLKKKPLLSSGLTRGPITVRAGTQRRSRQERNWALGSSPRATNSFSENKEQTVLLGIDPPLP
jgi:hypothetical protein